MGDVFFSAIAASSNYLFDINCYSFDDAQNFFSKLNTTNDVINSLKHPENLFLSENAPIDTYSQVEACLEEINTRSPKSDIDGINGSGRIFEKLIGRICQSIDIQYNCTSIQSQPLIPTKEIFNWIEVQGKISKKLLKNIPIEFNLELLKTNQLLNTELSWLENVPPEKHIQIREEGILLELRKIIALELDRIFNSTIYNFESAIKIADDNLYDILKRFEKSIKNLDSVYTKKTILSATLLLTSVFSALQPYFIPVDPQLIITFSAITGGYSLKDILQAAVDHKLDKKKLINSPTAILWKAQSMEKH